MHTHTPQLEEEESSDDEEGEGSGQPKPYVPPKMVAMPYGEEDGIYVGKVSPDVVGLSLQPRRVVGSSSVRRSDSGRRLCVARSCESSGVNSWEHPRRFTSVPC